METTNYEKIETTNYEVMLRAQVPGTLSSSPNKIGPDKM